MAILDPVVQLLVTLGLADFTADGYRFSVKQMWGVGRDLHIIATATNTKTGAVVMGAADKRGFEELVIRNPRGTSVTAQANLRIELRRFLARRLDA